MVLVQGDLAPSEIVGLASRVDVIINSANNHLLSRGCTGISGALLAAGGPELQRLSDAAKRNAGGEVAIGEAVLTAGGMLPCSVVHAVGMGYRHGNRVKATPDSVKRALVSALQVAGAAGLRTAATKLMCSRRGYSSCPDDEAPAMMLAAMRSAVEEAASTPGGCGALESIVVYVPAKLLVLPEDYSPPLTESGACARRTSFQ